MDAEFFEQLNRGNLGEISGELSAKPFEAFRLPADFGFKLVVTNLLGTSRGLLMADARNFPFSIQVASRGVGLTVCSLAFLLASSAATEAATAPSPASIVRHASAEYPRELHGLWMPEGMGCPTPINYDSEALLSIDTGVLGQYENTSKPLRVEQIAQRPPTWRILSAFSSGTGEYEGEENNHLYPCERQALYSDRGHEVLIHPVQVIL